MSQAAGLLIARLALAVVFFLAGAAKLADRTGSRASLVDFGVPPALASVLGVALPVVEIAVAMALLSATAASWGAIGALALLGVFTAGIVNLMVRGHQADCRCFGQLHSSPVGWSTLARNLALATIAALVLAGQHGRTGPSYLDWFGSLGAMEWVALLAVLLALGLLAAGFWFGLHLMRQHGRILLRLDALERALAERGIILAQEGLPVGAPAPAFDAVTLHGSATSLRELLAPGVPVLLLFTSPGCAACRAVLPDVAGWQREHDAGLTVALISQGSLEENRDMFDQTGVRHVLVQRAREIAAAFGADATPSAVLISRDGTIASSLAAGVTDVRALLGSLVPGRLSNQRLPGAIPLVSFDAG